MLKVADTTATLPSFFFFSGARWQGLGGPPSFAALHSITVYAVLMLGSKVLRTCFTAFWNASALVL